jgi:peptidoglycan/LPS O-acetylase OafA/YrhL
MSSIGNTAGGMAVMLAVIATAAGVGRFNAFYRRELAETGNRELSLDGLRGMAALMVVMHHAALSNIQLITGQWRYAGSPVLQAFGPGGVFIFFMLTGYLFWGKARAVKGRFNVWKLWRGRLLRIGPLYLFSLGAVLLIALAKYGARWLTLENAPSLLHLLPLGALEWQTAGPINFGDINKSVVWTLWYEWRFYLLLPLIAWFAVGRRTYALALIVYAVVFIGLWHGVNKQPGAVFILGMLCPGLLDDPRVRSELQRPIAAGIALALVAATLLSLTKRGYTLSLLPSISLAGALFPMFLVVAAGNSFIGFLTHPSIRCLGAISFSLYLLHGIVFSIVIGALQRLGPAAHLQPYYWPIITAGSVAATLLSAATYRYIEFPFLSLSHRGKIKSETHAAP